MRKCRKSMPCLTMPLILLKIRSQNPSYSSSTLQLKPYSQNTSILYFPTPHSARSTRETCWVLQKKVVFSRKDRNRTTAMMTQKTIYCPLFCRGKRGIFCLFTQTLLPRMAGAPKRAGCVRMRRQANFSGQNWRAMISTVPADPAEPCISEQQAE